MKLKSIFLETAPRQDKRQRRREAVGLLMAAPVLLGSTVFFILPFCITLYYSLTFGVGGAEFVGLSNYISVMRSESFLLAAGNTFRFLLLGIPAIVVISLWLALLLRRWTRQTGIFRNVLLFPMVVPVSGVVMCIHIFFDSQGVVNGVLSRWNICGPDWMNSQGAFWILLALYIWKNFGYLVILFLAGLSMIPEELYQTAELDGANRFSRFRYITFPLLVPTLFFVIVLSIINSFKSYREAFLLGGKYPNDSIYFIQHYLNNNFDNLNFQRLSVAAILLFSCLLILTFLLYEWQSRKGEGNVV